MKLFTSKKGFTLIELVMVIVILGILASVAVPKFTDIAQDAREAAEAGTIGGVRAGIMLYYATHKDGGKLNPKWPSMLDDSANTGTTNTTEAFFDTVLAQGGVMDGNWQKTDTGGNDTYTNANGTATAYQYYVLTGTFQ